MRLCGLEMVIGSCFVEHSGEPVPINQHPRRSLKGAEMSRLVHDMFTVCVLYLLKVFIASTNSVSRFCVDYQYRSVIF